MMRFLSGILLAIALFSVGLRSVSADHPVPEFDPAIHCAQPLAITTDDQLAGILADIDAYAVIENTFKALCFDPDTDIEIDDGTITITNNSSLPLIIYGLTLVDNIFSNTDFLVEVQGDNVILENSQVAYEYDPMLNNRGIRFNGTGNMFINSRAYGFHFSVVLSGDSNVIDGGIYDTIYMSGFGNEVRNSHIDGCAAENRFADFLHSRPCDSIRMDKGGIRAVCTSSTPQPGPYCTISDNEIIYSRYGIRLDAASEHVFISQNNIPTDKNEFRIYDQSNVAINFSYDPAPWHQVGASNIATHEADGGFHVMGSLDGVAGIDPAADIIELFDANGENARFIASCTISTNSEATIELADLDGDPKYSIAPGTLYYDCGIVNIGGYEEFSFTYTDADGSTSLYTRPSSMEVDWHFHCVGSVAQFNTNLSEIAQSGIAPILLNAQSFASIYPSKRVLCFPDSYYSAYITDPAYVVPHVDSTGMKFILHNLHIKAIANPHLPVQEDAAVLQVTGSNVDLLGGELIKSADIDGSPTGLLMEGDRHDVRGVTVVARDACIELHGYGHTVAETDISGCAIGVYADCAWPLPELADESSCVIGPDNYFHDIHDPGEYSIYLPSTARNVTATNNTIEIYPLDPLGDYLSEFEEFANDSIPPIDVEQTGLLDAETTCNHGSDCTIMGKIDDRFCEESSTIEIFELESDDDYASLTLEPYGTCSTIFYSDEEIELMRYRSQENPVYLTIQPGDCVFRCVVDWESMFINDDDSMLAYTITDSRGNTSEYSEMVKYFPTLFLSTYGTSSPQAEAEEDYSEDGGGFVAAGDDAEGGDDSWTEDADQEGNENIASLPSSLHGGITCSMNPNAPDKRPPISLLALLCIALSLMILRRKLAIRNPEI